MTSIYETRLIHAWNLAYGQKSVRVMYETHPGVMKTVTLTGHAFIEANDALIAICERAVMTAEMGDALPPLAAALNLLPPPAPSAANKSAQTVDFEDMADTLDEQPSF